MKLFKDMYKRANDSIPTSDAKARVMASVKKPTAVNPYKKVARFGALAACLLFTFASVSVFKNFEERNERNIMTPVNIEPNVSEKEITAKTPAKSEEIPKTTGEVVQKTKTETPPVGKKTESAKKPQTPVAIPTQKAEKVPENAVQVPKEPADVASSLKNEIIVNKMSAPEEYEVSAASVHSRGVAEKTEVSLAEYYEYLGKNIEEAIVLPDGFENQSQQTAFFETDDEGAYKNDEWSFMFKKGESFAEIITTKNTRDIQNIIESGSYEISSIEENEAVITADGDVYKAYMKAGDIGYKVTTAGIGEADFEKLMVSVVK